MDIQLSSDVTEDDARSLADNRSKFLERFFNEPGFEAKLYANPNAVLRDCGIDIPDGIEIKLVQASEAGPYHYVMPPDPNIELADETLGRVAGGGSTAGSAGTASTASTAVICVGTLSTAGTAGTATD